jgi:hypothetical protein
VFSVHVCKEQRANRRQQGLFEKEQTALVSLTPKQEAFAHHWAIGMTKADAYRSAYDCTTMSPAAIRIEACRLSQHPSVALMADTVKQEIQAESVSIAAYSRDHAFQDADADRALAHRIDQPGAAVSATKLKAQLAGHMDDKNSSDKALEALADLMASIARAGGDGTLKDGLEDGLTIDHEPN